MHSNTLRLVVALRGVQQHRWHAHTFLNRASPLVGSTVATAPREVVLSFSQNIEAAFSWVEVTDANGARVDQGKPQVSGNTMRVGLNNLPPGSYRVRWHVLSVNTHKTEPFISPQQSLRRAW